MIIKVCGMREAENIREVACTGINWMGFIFYAGSPRYVINANRDIPATSHCPLIKVGVFVNETAEYMIKTAKKYQLDYLQLHGNESPELCRMLHSKGYKLIKVFSVASPDDLIATRDYEGLTDYFLFDTKCIGYGGSGISFDWSVLYNYKGKTPFLLSGGISPESLDELKHFTHPMLAGVDLNSGFEIAPAIKDAGKIALFTQSLRNSSLTKPPHKGGLREGEKNSD